jgi:hypothetical protein
VRPLAPSPVWTLVTPYYKRTRPGRGTNTKAAGFPPLSRRPPATSLPPSRSVSRRPIWAGARGDIHSSAQGPPGLETPTNVDTRFSKHKIHPSVSEILYLRGRLDACMTHPDSYPMNLALAGLAKCMQYSIFGCLYVTTTLYMAAENNTNFGGYLSRPPKIKHLKRLLLCSIFLSLARSRARPFVRRRRRLPLPRARRSPLPAAPAAPWTPPGRPSARCALVGRRPRRAVDARRSPPPSALASHPCRAVDPRRAVWTSGRTAAPPARPQLSRAAHSHAARASPTRRTQAPTLGSTSAPLRYFLHILFPIFDGLLFFAFFSIFV